MTLRIERYKNTRHWALYDGQDLVVTVYRRGAPALLRRLAAPPPAGGHRRDQRERHRRPLAPPHSPW